MASFATTAVRPRGLWCRSSLSGTAGCEAAATQNRELKEMRNHLTEEQQRDVVAILNAGCDRATASAYVGLTLEAWDQVLAADAEFTRQILRAEANARLTHMRNVYRAAGDAKNWRTSVWWLERYGPQRSPAGKPAAKRGTRSAGTKSKRA